MESFPADTGAREPTLAEDPALGLSQRAKLEILVAVLLGLFLVALDQTIVGTALPKIVTSLGGNELLHLGRHDLPADQHDHRPVLRQAVRPLRPQADAHDRHQPVPDRLGPVRAEPGHVAAHPLPRHPGPRRRRPLPDRARGHRRPVHPGRARQVPGPLRSRLRHLVPDRARSRRLPHRQRQLALDLLRQHADRHRQPGRHLAACCRRSSGRTPRRNLDYLGALVFTVAIGFLLVGPDQQAVRRLGRPRGRRLHPDRARR